MPKFYPVVFKNDRQEYIIENGKIGLSTEENGVLDLTIKLQKNGQSIASTFLNEYLDGVMQSQTTSEEGVLKRMFLLNVDVLDLDPGYYSATWSPKKGKSYVFNFVVE